jgi:hypothetical protein
VPRVPDGEERKLTKAEVDAEPELELELELERGLAGAGVTPSPPPEAEPGIRSGGSGESNAAARPASPVAVRARAQMSSWSAEAALAKPWSVRNAMTSSSPGVAMRPIAGTGARVACSLKSAACGVRYAVASPLDFFF